MAKSSIPINRIRWSKYFRLISSQYPPVDLFDDIADAEDWWVLGEAESRTNPRISESLGKLDLIPRDRWVQGLGSYWLMAPFTHVSLDNKGRFNDGTFGVFYAANTFDTALFETVHHRSKFFKASKEDPGWIAQLRELIGSVDSKFHDIRKGRNKKYLDPDDYSKSQELAVRLRQGGSNGIVYPSVRHPSGQCFAAFYPDVMKPPKQGRLVSYHWDGERIDQIKFVTGKKEVFRIQP